MNDKFINNLKSLRTNKGLKQEELAKILGLSRSTITKYETGEREPDFEILEKIADYFNVSTDFLLGREKRELLNVNETTASYRISRISTLHEKIDRLPEEKQKLIETITDSFLKEEPPSDNNEQAAAGE